MMRVRSDGALLPAAAVRALGEISTDFARDTADITDRREHPVPLDPDRGRPGDLGAARRRRPEHAPRPAATRRGRSSAPPSPASPRTRSSTAPRRWTRSSAATSATRSTPTCRASSRPRSPATRATTAPPRSTTSSFVGTVHPEHGPGFDLWVGGGLSTNPMLAQKLGRLDPARRGRRRLGGRHLDLPRLRLPPAALARPAEVPGRRLGRGEVPRGARERVPRTARSSTTRSPRLAQRPPATTSACTSRRTAGSTSASRRPSAASTAPR